MHLLFEESASCLSINLETNTVENWLFESDIETNYKSSDECLFKFETAAGTMETYRGYVPDFFPGKHYGDYIELLISKTGVVQELKVTDADIEKALEEAREYGFLQRGSNESTDDAL